ncbi:MAG TPA: four helix bundle protein [Terriglobia bacterium]|jgi:four helix bundle protein|nr:four helix bundle protein [Terriglobia bacterium]
MPESHPWEELRSRTKQFAIRVVKLYRALPRTREAQVLGTQVLRSGTSVAANYRAVCRARSKAEFVSKMGVVVEEADETVFWLELLVETEIVTGDRMKKLLGEANELLAIFAASQRTAKGH